MLSMVTPLSPLLYITLLFAAAAVSVAAATGTVTSRQVQGVEEICGFAGGTVDADSGVCIICLSEENCCELDASTYAVSCSNFCTTTVFQNAKQTACGTAFCAPQGIESVCTASIPFTPDLVLDLSFNCASGGICACNVATWNGQDCTSCDGPGGGYDCTNVNGPVKEVSGENGGGEGGTSPTSDLPRPYLDDPTFQSAVADKSLPNASNEAGVPIGAAISTGRAKLEDYVPSEYNYVVAENSMKWNKLLADGETLGLYNFTEADALVDYARGVKAELRGHVLIWGRFRGTTYPEAVALAVEQSNDQRETLIGIMTEHIDTVSEHFRGDVRTWDVVNEHLSAQDPEQNVFYKVLGDDYVKIAFELARNALRKNDRLVWNEALGNFNLSDPQIAKWLELLKRYKDDGVPIDGIGVQGHSINKLHNITELRIFLDAVVSMGYEVELTEIDAPITLFLDAEGDPFQAQADYLAEYARACLDTGSCKGITFWGVDDSLTWLDWAFPSNKPNLPLLIDENGKHKPAWLSIRRELESHASSSAAAGAPESTRCSPLVAAATILISLRLMRG